MRCLCDTELSPCGVCGAPVHYRRVWRASAIVRRYLVDASCQPHICETQDLAPAPPPLPLRPRASEPRARPRLRVERKRFTGFDADR